jgi:hypothetical protein
MTKTFEISTIATPPKIPKTLPLDQRIPGIFTGVVLGSLLSVGILSQPAQAQPAIPPGLANDLNYPNNSQRFFDQSRSRMEWEIYLLQQRSLHPEDQEPILTISQDFFDKQEQLLQGLEKPLNRTETQIRILEPGFRED